MGTMLTFSYCLLPGPSPDLPCRNFINCWETRMEAGVFLKEHFPRGGPAGSPWRAAQEPDGDGSSPVSDGIQKRINSPNPNPLVLPSPFFFLLLPSSLSHLVSLAPPAARSATATYLFLLAIPPTATSSDQPPLKFFLVIKWRLW